MPKVYLRQYDRDIESLTEQGHPDEAIAHCRHILQSFPKHLETYRLLGKAYLESKRYVEAVDIFNRVLMAVPDDFVSHVGMSIIDDEQGNLDDSIWHMERAFESQPSNAAIQGELQRLYGRRDGVEPPKVRMTRGALAHMYVQGELYPQAISEVRAVLGQDPKRADMQVLLARAYFHSGQKADAGDMCAQLLKRYPYCFDANRIMVALLPSSERTESTQVYRHRVLELDPYAAFSKESPFRADEVADSAVNLERLDYHGQDVEMGREWDASLGIGLAATTSVNEQPEWLRSASKESKARPLPQEAPPSKSPEAISAAAEPAASESISNIPEFLRQAGWKPSSGEVDESAPPFETPDESPVELTPADLPGWLKDKMPPDEPAKPSAPAFISESATPQPPVDLDATQKSQPAAELEPFHQDSLGATQPSHTPALEQTGAEAPDWLKSLTAPAAPEPSAAEDLPDWLKNLAEPKAETDSGPAETSVAAEPESQPPEVEQAEAALPESIQAEPPPPAPSLETLGASAKEQDDAVAWLESLAAKHGARPEELVTDPAARTEQAPEWVEQARSLAESQSARPEPAAPELPPEDKTGIWLRDLEDRAAEVPLATEPHAEGQPLLSENEPPEWLRAARGEQTDREPQSSGPFPMPDWLADLQRETPEAAPPAPEQTAEVTPPAELSPPDWLAGLQKEAADPAPSAQVPTAPTSPSDESPAPDWLAGLEQQSAPSEPVESKDSEEPKPVTLTEAEMPAWLRGFQSPTQDSAGTQDEVAAQKSELSGAAEDSRIAPVMPADEPTSGIQEITAADLPEWLSGLDDEQPPAERPAITEDAPAWLKGEQAVPQAQPTSPSDWRPVEAMPEPPRSAEFAETQRVSPEAAQAPVSGTMLSDETALAGAQEGLQRGDIPAALDNYNRLIKTASFVEETIRDLRDAVYRYPVEVSIWQTLGDAYMRANRLQEALDAYNKAEELLR